MTNIEELTKLLFEFEAEMEYYEKKMTEHWDKHREYDKLSKAAASDHSEAQTDYKEAARQYQLIKNQLREAVKVK